MLYNMHIRNLIGIIVSVVLIMVLVMVFSDPWSTIRKDGKRILLPDPESIDRIILSDAQDSTYLIKKSQEWLISGMERVNQVAVENLLFAAERLQINSIVTREPEATQGLWRRIQFLKGERVVLAYDFQSSGDQTLLRPLGSGRTFMVSLSGYSGQNLDKVFSSNANHYREHLLIDLRPSEISLLKIELAGGEAFHFTQDEMGVIVCTPANSLTVLPSSAPDDLSIRLLFSYFTSIRFEDKAGIRAADLGSGQWQEKIMARLHVESHGGEQHTLQVFPYYEVEGAGPHMFKAVVTHNHDPEALLVNYIYLDVLMRHLSHYFTQ